MRQWRDALANSYKLYEGQKNPDTHQHNHFMGTYSANLLYILGRFCLSVWNYELRIH
jgi:hypothetical protein